jgi:sulfonate transport system permease protein
MSALSATRSYGWRGWVIPLALLLLWEISARLEWVSSLILVPFSQLFTVVLDAQLRASFAVGLADTFTRLLQGSVIGIVLGLLFGTALGLSHSCDRIMGPSFHAVRQVAVFAWIPLLTAWFGIGPACKIIFVAIAAFKPVVMGAYEGIRNVPPQYLEVGKVLCFSRTQMLRRIILPSAAPAIVTSLQLALIFSWVAAIGAEYVIGAMSGGIGSVVSTAQEHFRTDVVLVGVILISGVGILMNKGLRRIPHYLFKWRDA